MSKTWLFFAASGVAFILCGVFVVERGSFFSWALIAIGVFDLLMAAFTFFRRAGGS